MPQSVYYFIISGCPLSVSPTVGHLSSLSSHSHHWITNYIFFCFFISIFFAWLFVSDTDESLPFYEVLVGVLSARHHYELRQAIRQTWLGYIRDHPHFQLRSVGWSSNFISWFSFFLSLFSRPDSYSGNKACGF